MTVPYSPPGYAQMDGSKFASANCVLATCTDLIDRSTVGALRIAAPILRTVSGDTSGGVTYSQAATAVWTATKHRVGLTPRIGGRTQTRDLAEAGIPFGISIDTYVTRSTRFRTGTFIGGHTVYVQDYDEADNTYLVEDPGTTAAGYMWWPADLLYRAAERRGGGRINVLVGRDTEGVTRKGVGGKIRAKPATDALVKASVTPGTVYTVIDTVNGGPWRRADGGVGRGWHHVPGGYVEGRGLRE